MAQLLREYTAPVGDAVTEAMNAVTNIQYQPFVFPLAARNTLESVEW